MALACLHAQQIEDEYVCSRDTALRQSLDRLNVSHQIGPLQVIALSTLVITLDVCVMQIAIPAQLQASIARAQTGLLNSLMPLPAPQVVPATHDLHQQATR